MTRVQRVLYLVFLELSTDINIRSFHSMSLLQGSDGIHVLARTSIGSFYMIFSEFLQ